MGTTSSHKVIQADKTTDHILCFAERRKLEATISQQAAEITQLKGKLA